MSFDILEEAARAMAKAQHIDPDAPVLFGMRTTTAWEARLPAARAAVAIAAEYAEMFAAAAAGCCDTPERTAAFVRASFASCDSRSQGKDAPPPHRI